MPASLKKDEKVLRGRNGRLFLANDTNEILRQHAGQRMLTERELARWGVTLAARRALGIPQLFLVPPNAHSVYPEDLPSEIVSAEERPIHQLIKQEPDIVYPLDDLLAAKPDPLLYSKGDSHWTGRGAFIVYKRLVREIEGLAAMHDVRAEDVRFTEDLRVGELGYKLEPAQKAVEIFSRVVQPRPTLVSDNLIVNTGMHVVTDCPGAPPTTCVVFGDSFTGDMLPFLASSFRRLVFCHLPMFDLDVIEEERADLILTILNERFLVVVPPAVARGALREFEREKLAIGEVRPIIGSFDTPPAVEGAPATR